MAVKMVVASHNAGFWLVERHAQADGRPANAAFFCYGNEIAETPEVHFCYTELVWVSCAMVLDGKSI